MAEASSPNHQDLTSLSWTIQWRSGTLSSQFRLKQMTVREAKMGSTAANKIRINSYCLNPTNDLCACSSWASSFCPLCSISVIIYKADKAMALTVPAEGAGSWPWHQPTPQRGAVGFQFSSYWGSHQETGSDREPVETAAHSLSPGLTPLWSGWKYEKRKGR